jgi:hypothetical protein
MSTMASPLMIPGAVNPSGTQATFPAPFSGAPGTQFNGTGTNPYMPGMNPAQNPNPYASGSGGFSAYGFGAPGGGTSGGGTVPTSPNIPGINIGNTGALNPSQTSALTSQLDKTYGKGMGALLQQFLSSGAGYNPQVLQQLFAQLQPQFANQQQNLMQQFSASGNRFGSGAQTGYADLLGQQSLTEGDIASQLYERSVQNYMQILEGTSAADASRIANTPSWLDNFAQFMDAVKGGVTAPTSAGGGGGGGGGFSSGGGGAAAVGAEFYG